MAFSRVVLLLFFVTKRIVRIRARSRSFHTAIMKRI